MEWTLVRHGGRHELWRCGASEVVLPRHADINGLTALGVKRMLENELRVGVVAMTEPATVSYLAVARRSGRWWAVEVPSLPGVFTQARTLDAVEPMVRDAIAMFRHAAAESIAVEVQCEPPAEARGDVEEALARRAEAERAQAAATAAMRQAVAALAQIGLTNRDAGRLLGVSHQRVAQIAASGKPAAGGRPGRG